MGSDIKTSKATRKVKKAKLVQNRETGSKAAVKADTFVDPPSFKTQNKSTVIAIHNQDKKASSKSSVSKNIKHPVTQKVSHEAKLNEISSQNEVKKTPQVSAKVKRLKIKETWQAKESSRIGKKFGQAPAVIAKDGPKKKLVDSQTAAGKHKVEMKSSPKTKATNETTPIKAITKSKLTKKIKKDTAGKIETKKAIKHAKSLETGVGPAHNDSRSDDSTMIQVKVDDEITLNISDASLSELRKIKPLDNRTQANVREESGGNKSMTPRKKLKKKLTGSSGVRKGRSGTNTRSTSIKL